jgi:hypothetical protein
MGSFAAKFTPALDDINEALGIPMTHAASNVLLLRIIPDFLWQIESIH